MKKLFFLFALLTSWNLHAQTYEWTNTLGGSDNSDYGYDIEVDHSGNVYVAGTCSSSSVDFDPSPATFTLTAPSPGALIHFIAKYDDDGNLLWAINAGQSECISMCLDASANIYVTGNFNDSTDIDPTTGTFYLYGNGSSADLFLSKYDSSGNLIWGHSFGGTSTDYGHRVTVDGANNVYVTGYFSDTIDFDPSTSVNNVVSNGNWDIFLAKYDPSGNYLWAMNAGSSSNDDVSRGISVDPDNNVYITGYFGSTVDFDPSAAVNALTSAGGADVFIAKYDQLGNYIWAKSIGNASSGDGTYSIYSNTNHIFIIGNVLGTLDVDPGPGVHNLVSVGSSDLFFAKYDIMGNFIFANSIGGNLDDKANEMIIDSSENIYITGRFKNTVDFDPGSGTTTATSSAGSSDLFISKYNPMGNFVWVKTVGGTGEDIGQSLTLSSTGDIYITGWYSNTVDFFPGTPVDNHTSNGARDVFFTKYSNPTTAIENAQEMESNLFKLYPNPTNGLLFCEVSENTEISVYNSTGELVLSRSLNLGKHTVDISAFSKGIYLVRSNLNSEGMMVIKQ